MAQIKRGGIDGKAWAAGVAQEFVVGLEDLKAIAGKTTFSKIVSTPLKVTVDYRFHQKDCTSL